jgi:hypothetical protein
MMTRQNYEKLAAVLGSSVPRSILLDVTDRVAKVLAADNPRFNYDRFLAAVDKANMESEHQLELGNS